MVAAFYDHGPWLPPRASKPEGLVKYRGYNDPQKPPHCGYFDPIRPSWLGGILNFSEKFFKNRYPVDVLDVGCGPGNMLDFVQGFMYGRNLQSSWRTHGIEYDLALYELASKKSHHVMHCDALKFPLYCEYNFIYCFNILHRGPQEELNRKIVKDAAPGALIVFVCCGEELAKDAESLHIKQLAKNHNLGNIYKKIAK